MMLDRAAVISGGVKGIRFGTHAKSHIFLAAQLARDQESGVRQVQGLACIHADPFVN